MNMPNSDTITEDSYDKVNTEVILLIGRLKIAKEKRSNTSWYHIWTLIQLRKEISCIEMETDKIGERLLRLDMEGKNPIQIVKRV